MPEKGVPPRKEQAHQAVTDENETNQLENSFCDHMQANRLRSGQDF
jgi:hypothetical protein